MLRRVCLLVLLCVFLTFPGFSQKKSSAKQELNGSLVAENVYTNPALGMKITLPLAWDLLPSDSSPSNPPSDCRGPLCGQPEIKSSVVIKCCEQAFALKTPVTNPDTVE